MEHVSDLKRYTIKVAKEVEGVEREDEKLKKELKVLFRHLLTDLEVIKKNIIEHEQHFNSGSSKNDFKILSNIIENTMKGLESLKGLNNHFLSKHIDELLNQLKSYMGALSGMGDPETAAHQFDVTVGNATRAVAKDLKEMFDEVDEEERRLEQLFKR